MKTFKLLAVSALVTAACINPAMAEHTPEHKTETATTASKKASKSTAEFIKNAGIGGMFEIDSSKLALEKSDNDDVKKFAQSMIDDHSNANDQLKSIIASENIDSALIPAELDAKHQAVLDKLKESQNFDADYIKAQTDAHKEAITVFSKYSKKGDNKALKAFATDTLPKLKEHKAMIPAHKSK